MECADFKTEAKQCFGGGELGGIDIQRNQIMAAARWMKPVKWMVRRS